jgi:hypothetical protein
VDSGGAIPTLLHTPRGKGAGVCGVWHFDEVYGNWGKYWGTVRTAGVRLRLGPMTLFCAAKQNTFTGVCAFRNCDMMSTADVTRAVSERAMCSSPPRLLRIIIYCIEHTCSSSGVLTQLTEFPVAHIKRLCNACDRGG